MTDGCSHVDMKINKSCPGLAIIQPGEHGGLALRVIRLYWPAGRKVIDWGRYGCWISSNGCQSDLLTHRISWSDLSKSLQWLVPEGLSERFIKFEWGAAAALIVNLYFNRIIQTSASPWDAKYVPRILRNKFHCRWSNDWVNWSAN